MTATATVTAMQRNDVLLVPNTALRFTPTAAGEGKAAAKGGIVSSLIPSRPADNTRKSAAAGAKTSAARQVWVLPKDGNGAAVAVAMAVIPGISDGHMTEIAGGDLQAGMQVITDQKTAAAK
jgi:HlyD family secretion protein